MPVTVDGELFGDTLPTYLTRFVGREREMRDLQLLLRCGRLITICGLGGAGKTRLAIEVARRERSSAANSASPIEVYWVPLGGVTDPDDVSAAVAAGLGLTGSFGVQPTPVVVRALSARRALIVLDNCEQVATGCRQLLTQVLARCAGVTALVTSRVPLGLTAHEKVFAIPELGGQGPPADTSHNDATALFLERATLAAPTYALTDNNRETVDQICAAVHGLPLAIELAASWIFAVSPQDLLAQITQASDALTSDSAIVADRHRSLRAILDSSWRWLDDGQRSVLGCLSVFIGGFTREAAEAVAGAGMESLAALISRSMIQRLPDATGGSRYQVHELVRCYALKHMADADAAARRHCDYFIQQVESLEPSWNTPVEPLWSDPIGAELRNLDAATVWALAQGDADRALRMAGGLDAFWIFSSPSASVRRARLEAALALPWEPTSVTSVRARAKAYHVAGLRSQSDDPGAAQRLVRAGEALFAQIGDQAGVAACIRDRGAANLLAGDLETARRDVLLGLALSQECGDAQGEAWSVLLLGRIALDCNQLGPAISSMAGALQMFERLGSPFGACHTRVELAEAYRRAGRWAEAVEAYERAFQDQLTYHFTVETTTILEGLAVIAAALHHFELAAHLCGAAGAWRRAYEELGWFRTPDEFDQTERSIRRHLGEEAWSRAYPAGEAMTADGAARLAADVLHDLAAELQLRPSGLTSRELDVLRLVAQGRSNAEIADVLILSPRTVHAHLRSIFDKLHVTSRTAAAHAAAGILPRDVTGDPDHLLRSTGGAGRGLT